ncbi:MAG: aminoacyl-tRNA hydrolase [Candidatus Dormibacteraeota bacterium]|nr:aminoacyl-tRNA hydrolase [Candidatus Dormibacteraeota bacterium]
MSASRSPSSDLLVVGLGNPGPEFAGSRHNMGWSVVDAFARDAGMDLSRRRWYGKVGNGTIAGTRVWLLKPQTYMNESGRSVKKALHDLELPLERVWVVHDELDIPLGRLRIRIGGSAAGNNGVRSIIGALGGDGFVRFRVGIGKAARKGSEAGVRHVLSTFRGRDADAAAQVVLGTAKALRTGVEEGLERAMNRYNREDWLQEEHEA